MRLGLAPATQYRNKSSTTCGVLVGTVLLQRAAQSTTRQYGQRLQVVGVHRTERDVFNAHH